jgi:excisionase family DNA binding protein
LRNFLVIDEPLYDNVTAVVSHIKQEIPPNVSLVLHDELLTADELAQFLKLACRTVYRMLEAGELPFALKVKGSWRFRMSDVEKWLESQKVSPEPTLLV